MLQSQVPWLFMTPIFYGSLIFYLDNPWGADTLNITGAFLKKNDTKWKIFLLARDLMYKR